MKGKGILFCFLLSTLLVVEFLAIDVSSALAQTRLSVQGAGRLYPIAVPRLCIQNASADSASEMADVLAKDLTFSGYFRVVNPNAYIASEDCSNPEQVAYSDWSVIGADGLVRGVIQSAGGDRVTVQMYLHDVQLKKVVLGKEYTGSVDQVRDMAHRFANLIMKFFTGEEGVFGTKIVYTGRNGRFKELYMMDMDGGNVRQLTRDNGLNMFANWDPRGGRIVFTGYRNRQPDVFMLDLNSRNTSRVTDNGLMEVGPRFSNDGRSLLMARNSGKSSELIVTDLKGTMLRRITKTSGVISVSGDWSPDGSKIVYVSNATGGPQVYVLDRAGAYPRRVSKVPSGYCTSPAWSPNGNKIAFVCRADSGYQIYTVNPDGSDAFQLTGTGSNEDPSWAPNSKYLVFSTTAGTGGVKKLAIVEDDGSNFRILTSGRAEETDPAWGPRS